MKKHHLIIILNMLFVLSAYSQNSAIHLDGIDDFIEIPSKIANFDHNEDFTISIWIKPALDQPNINNHDNDFLEKWDFEGSYPFVMRYMNQKASKDSTGKIIVGRYDTEGNNPMLLSTKKINDGNWHNIIFIKDEENLLLYIDGKPAGNLVDFTEATTKNNSPLFIGKRGPNFNFFKGEIDELHIWDYANYSATEKIYNKLPSEDGLLASYNFDEGIPNGINDTEYKLHDYLKKNDGDLINFELDGDESNFVVNPIIFKDTSTTTITIRSPIGLVNNRKNVIDNEIFISGIVNSATPITTITINGNIVSNFQSVTLFQQKFSLTEGENKIIVIATDKYGKKTQTEFTIVKDEPQINTTLAELPKIDLGRRIALVIGNSDYKNALKLKNPVNDANLMSKELTNLGFKVEALIDGTKVQIRQAIINHKNELLKDSKTTGLFYYAGHGIQDKKQHNYIVPVEASMNNEDVIEDECYDIERLLLNLKEAKNDLNIVILDACRNNPFARSFRGDAGGGLAAIKTPAKGTFIAYATEPGNVADDGKGENGLYTEALVKALREPRLKIEEVFKLTREEVYKNSNEKQLPWDRAFFLGNFYFNVK
jgi:Caspase domain/Concanavalin A-like lectin/glucanases superfamily